MLNLLQYLFQSMSHTRRPNTNILSVFKRFLLKFTFCIVFNAFLSLCQFSSPCFLRITWFPPVFESPTLLTENPKVATEAWRLMNEEIVILSV